MFEFLWRTGPFDDDYDFAFEDGNAELASEIREYDIDDDEFDAIERASVTIHATAPAPEKVPAPEPAVTVAEPLAAAKKPARKKTPAKRK